jgi:hydroxymethylglutaryl-CoA lyase
MQKLKVNYIYKKLNPILFDVSLRDGLQGFSKYEQTLITLETKEKIYNNICSLHEPSNIEVGSVVNPKILPVMANSLQLFRNISLKNSQLSQTTSYSPKLYMLVPNKKGYDNAIENGVTHFSFLTAVSESFQKKNINKTLQETKNELRDIINDITDKKTFYLPSELNTKLYISCINECPIEGKINNDIVVNEIIYYNKHTSVNELCLSDTCGSLLFEDFRYIIDKCIDLGVDIEKISLHLHISDNIDNIRDIVHYSLDNNIIKFDVSSLTSGGCSVTMDQSKLKPNMSYELLYKLFDEYVNKIEDKKEEKEEK